MLRAGGLYARQFWADSGPMVRDILLLCADSMSGSMATGAIMGSTLAIKHCVLQLCDQI